MASELTDFRARDRAAMFRALDLAKLARGRVAPNPAVGAVIVRDGEIVGEGYTRPPGGCHAEIVALQEAGDRARGATVYVTLEPCAHIGRTPPCSASLISAGIGRVVAAVCDPFPEVNGRGIRQLHDAGIAVEVGIGASAAVELNAGFFKRLRTGLPEVTAKFAMSLDGKIATRTGHSRWITGDESRQQAHMLRDTHDAILVGVGTVLADNPVLTTRLPDAVSGFGGPHHPLRVVLDSRGRTPVEAAMLHAGQPGRTVIATTERAPEARRRLLEQAGAEVVVLPADGERVDLGALLRHLGDRGINSVLVEGGGEVHGALFDAGQVDRVVAFIAPVIVGGRGAPSAIAGLGVAEMGESFRLSGLEIRQCGDDVMVAGRTDNLSSLVEELGCLAGSSRRSAPLTRSFSEAVTTR